MYALKSRFGNADHLSPLFLSLSVPILILEAMLTYLRRFYSFRRLVFKRCVGITVGFLELWVLYLCTYPYEVLRYQRIRFFTFCVRNEENWKEINGWGIISQHIGSPTNLLMFHKIQSSHLFFDFGFIQTINDKCLIYEGISKMKRIDVVRVGVCKLSSL